MPDCSKCGSPNAQRMKHLPLPNGRNGWIELSEWTNYCTLCAEKESIKNDEIIQRAKEIVRNG